MCGDIYVDVRAILQFCSRLVVISPVGRELRNYYAASVSSRQAVHPDWFACLFGRIESTGKHVWTLSFLKKKI